MIVVAGRGGLGTGLAVEVGADIVPGRETIMGLLHWPRHTYHVVNCTGSCGGYAITDNLGMSLRLLRNLPPECQSVTFLGSVVGEIGVKGTLEYSASKTALHGLVRTAARELAPVRVNCLDLGYFDRGMIREVPEKVLDRTLKQIPLGRLGSCRDLAAAVRFVTECEYITGAVVKVNGGLT